MVVRFTMTWDRVLTSEKEGLSVPVPGFSVLHATSWILETGPSELAPSVANLQFHLYSELSEPCEPM